LIGFKVDVIVAAGPTALAAKKATSTIPIVCVATGDPVRFGLVGSLARPGGNVTGLALIVDTTFVGKWLELLRETAPRISRVRYLHDSSMGLPGPDLAELRSKLEFVEVRELSQIETAIARIAKERGGVVVPPAPFFFTHRTRIAELAAQHRVPAIYGFRAFVDAGGLMSYGLDLPDVWRRASGYVDRILKGAKPSDLPVEQPTKHELLINLKTAKALGLTIPPSLLLRADQVIE
jgi:putative ABC transport system substrate-binding protein